MSSLADLIEEIHEGPWRAVLAITGGGSSAIGRLLSVPGGSATLLDARVPYSHQALSKFLGGSPDQFCSPETARALAMQSFCEGLALDVPPSPEWLVGVGCTAALSTGRPKRGEHRVHLGFQTLQATHSVRLQLEKGKRDRRQEEQLVADHLLLELARMCGLKASKELALLPAETVYRETQAGEADWQALLGGEKTCIPATGCTLSERRTGMAIFAGTFHPMHRGHRTMARLAAERLGRVVQFEISIHNVDKPPLDYLQIAERVERFRELPLWLTAAPTFVQKAELFPEATFVIGADTIRRIADPRYYGSESARDAAVERLRASKAEFLVFGRQDAEDKFAVLDELDLPVSLRELCRGVTESEFREDISSSQLRADNGNSDDAR